MGWVNGGCGGCVGVVGLSGRVEGWGPEWDGVREF